MILEHPPRWPTLAGWFMLKPMPKKPTKSLPPKPKRRSDGEGRGPRYNVQVERGVMGPLNTLAGILAIEGNRYVSKAEAIKIAIREAIESRDYNYTEGE